MTRRFATVIGFVVLIVVWRFFMNQSWAVAVAGALATAVMATLGATFARRFADSHKRPDL